MDILNSALSVKSCFDGLSGVIILDLLCLIFFVRYVYMFSHLDDKSRQSFEVKMRLRR